MIRFVVVEGVSRKRRNRHLAPFLDELSRPGSEVNLEPGSVPMLVVATNATSADAILSERDVFALASFHGVHSEDIFIMEEESAAHFSTGSDGAGGNQVLLNPSISEIIVDFVDDIG